jgi:ferredoxin-nitrite reductase
MHYNKIERLKRELCPADFKEKIMQLNLEQLTEADRFYLKNYGIYTSKLMPERFMLRIRVAGGRLALKLLKTLYWIMLSEGVQIVLTSRAQIELHGLDAANVLQVWRKLSMAGMTTLQTLTDNCRNIVTDPYDGIVQENLVETYPLILEMQALFLERAEWMGMLPRKFNTAISGTTAHFTHFYSNDLYFSPAKRGESIGFNLYLGGKNSAVAQAADLFVLPSEVPSMFLAVLQVYSQYGSRQTRSKTRLFHLIEAIGMKAFKEKLLTQYGKTVQCGGESLSQKIPVPSSVRLKDGTYGQRVESFFGRVDRDRVKMLIEVAEAEQLEVRIGVDQNFYLLGLESPEKRFETVQGAGQVTACAGSRYCALSLWNIKEETVFLPLEKLQTYQIQVGFSGCLKGCGRHHHCDIGLVGLRTNSYGPTQKAARIFLGGQYSSGGMPARLIFSSVPLKHLRGLLEVVIASFEMSGEDDFERFTAHYLNRHSTFFVTMWFLAQLYLAHPPKLTVCSEAELYQTLLLCEDFPAFEEDEHYFKSIKVMMHALWDEEAG